MRPIMTTSRHTDREIPVHLAALRDVGDADMVTWRGTIDIHLASGRLQHASHHFEERALARAIRTDHSDHVPRHVNGK